jgi:hypothetical protein
VLPLARSTAQVKLAINLRMSQAAGTPGRPWQDGPTAPRIATPASTQMIPAIGLKKDIAAAFNLRHHACIKASTSVKVRSARKIGLATLVPLSKNVIPPATLVYCFAVWIVFCHLDIMFLHSLCRLCPLHHRMFQTNLAHKT